MANKKTRCVSAIAYVPIQMAVEALSRTGQGFAVIAHKGEKIAHENDGEVGKDHLHIIIDRSHTNGHLMDDVKALFRVDTGDGAGCACKLVGVRDFCMASEWHQYVMHDIKYLADKGMEREYHYCEKDLFVHDMSFATSDDFIHCAQSSKKVTVQEVRDAYLSGKTWFEFSAGLAYNEYAPCRKIWADMALHEHKEQDGYVKFSVIRERLTKCFSIHHSEDVEYKELDVYGNVVMVVKATGAVYKESIFNLIDIKGELDDEI